MADPTEQQQPKPSRLRRFLSFFSKSEWVNVFLTAVIAATGVVGIFLVIQGSSDTARIRDAAEQQASAARSFAESAKKTNEGIGNAVLELGQQADDAENFFRTDERAWIEIEPMKTPGIPNHYDLYPKNVGKTAARGIVVHANDTFQISSMIGMSQNVSGIHNMLDRGPLLEDKGKKNGPPETMSPIPEALGPGVTSPVPIRCAAQLPTGSSRNPMVGYVIGRIDYRDEFQVKHWRKFCFYVGDASGDLATCKAGNDEDHNPEIQHDRK
jgi:hypothetical protein